MASRINFLGSPRIAPDHGIVVDALVDGQLVICHFAREVLDGTASNAASISVKELFENKRSALLQIAERKLRTGQFKSGKTQIGISDF